MRGYKRSRRYPDTKMYPTVRLHPSSQKYISKVINKAVQNISPVDKTEASNIHRVINYKNMNALIVSPYNEGLHWRTPQIITEQLKQLVHEAYVIKAYPGFLAELFQYHPDLLIFIGNDYEFSPEDKQILGQLPMKTAIWLSDHDGSSEEIKGIASLFDYVFTQTSTLIPFYQFESDVQHVHHLPFAADMTIFHPKPADEACQSSLLILGDAAPRFDAFISQLPYLMKGKKIFASGRGWEPYGHIRCLSADANLANYYNGADMVINWSGLHHHLFECASCGAFQLIREHPGIYDYFKPGHDVAVFHNPDDLLDNIVYYSAQVEQKRSIATNALQGSMYRYSFLQMVYQLLHVMHTH